MKILHKFTNRLINKTFNNHFHIATLNKDNIITTLNKENTPNLYSFIYSNNINFKKGLIGKGNGLFLNSKVELKHKLTDQNINTFRDGIRSNSYKLYDKYINLPEVLFLGRSNVGKSSLINSLFNKKLTKPSKVQGKTQSLEFYLMSYKKKDISFILDAPGYGYVSGPKILKDKFKYLIDTYLHHAVRLKVIFYLINGKYELQKTDLLELERLNNFNIDITIVFTKVDRFSDPEVIALVNNISDYTRKLKNVRTEMLMTSTRNMFGIENLRSYIEKELKVKVKDEEYDTIDISNIQDNIENESD